tara:strand:+ start:3965 stop:4900 length:936 start_codon:yes stop_codon:yes gene_type:complete
VEFISLVWDEAIIKPMVNSLVLLYYLFFGNFGLAIISFTILVRLAMIPLSLKQSRQMRAMSKLQPRMKDIQDRYKNDRARASQETMKLYREEGVSPLGCLGPMIIQMPIFIGLFWALRRTLPSTPERLVDLSESLYSWLYPVNTAVPLDGTFLWLNLAEFSINNPAAPLLPILVGGSMWLMQKMSSMPATSPQQESTNRMMLWMMPIMFGVFTFQFEAGLALYWIMSNIIGIIIQGFTTGWGPLAKLLSFGGKSSEGPAEVNPSRNLQEPAIEEEIKDENQSNDSKDGRRGNRNRSKGTRRRPRGGRGRRR